MKRFQRWLVPLLVSILLTAAVDFSGAVETEPAAELPARKVSREKTASEASRAVDSKPETEKPAGKARKEKQPPEPLFDQREQDELVKERFFEYLKDETPRSLGEGRLFIAKHHFEMDELDKALFNLDTLLFTNRIDPQVRWEAQLLFAEILGKQEKFDLKLKELNRLIEWNPDREWLVRALIARAELIGRSLTKTEDLFKVYHRYFKCFPEQKEVEAIDYLIGFERGYDLEVGMQALEAWERLIEAPEPEVAALANLHIAMMYAYDLRSPLRAKPFLEKVPDDLGSPAAVTARFVLAAINHFHLPRAQRDYQKAIEHYSNFRDNTADLKGWRIATIMLGRLLADRLDKPEEAVEVWRELVRTPPHLAPDTSISLAKRLEEEDEQSYWAVFALKMAGHTAEYLLKNPDMARGCYSQASGLHKSRKEQPPDFFLDAAMKRTEPQVTPAQFLFEKAYEKYRSRHYREAYDLYERFIREFPDHQNVREALYRTAIIVNDDFKDYDQAMELYQRYLIRYRPRRSVWNLDTLYDWSRVDEVRYRMGNLLLLHRKDPVGALKIFEDLAATYPNSYWAMQGWKDSIRLLR